MLLADLLAVNITILLNSKCYFLLIKIKILFKSNFLNLKIINSFDPEQDRWFLIAPMRSKRLAVGVAVVNRLVSIKLREST